MGAPFVTKEITNQMIYDKLEAVHTTVTEHGESILLLNKRSIGMLIFRHPYRFGATLVALVATFISDFRHPIIALLTKLF